MLALTLYCDKLTVINSNIINLYSWLIYQPIIHRPYLSCKQGQNISENFNFFFFFLTKSTVSTKKKKRQKNKLNNSLVVKSSKETKQLNVLLKVRVTQLSNCAERNQASTSTFKPESNAHQLSGGFIARAAKCFWI